MSVVHYKQIVRRFNALRNKKRYKEKRIRRAYLTEAFFDNEIELYKPAHVPYKIYTDKTIPVDMNIANPVCIEEDYKRVRLNWFEKFVLWIRKMFK